MTKKIKKSLASDNECTKQKAECKILTIHGGDYLTTYTKKFENRKKWVKDNPKNVKSYIPGTIKEIFVSEGEKVKKGDKLLLLESMKMLNLIEVPLDGIISKIHISAEEKIPKDHLMVEFK